MFPYRFRNTTALGEYGAALATVWQEDGMALSECLFEGNAAASGRGGALAVRSAGTMSDGAEVLVVDSAFRGNQVTDPDLGRTRWVRSGHSGGPR